MKVLFLGGTGNISAECVALLLQRGQEVTVLTRGRSAVPQGCQVLQADRKNPDSVRSAVGDRTFDVVVNFLGYELEEVQADAALFKSRTAHYVFISSATVYAKPPARLPITEDAPLGNPWWDYAQKKLLCEQWLMEQWATARFPVTIVRPSHTYSKWWIPNPVSSSSYTFAARLEAGKPVYAHDRGETLWTLTASSDFAAGLAGLLGQEAALGQAFHITSDEALTWNRIYAEIAHSLGVALPEVVQIPTDFICEVASRFIGTLKGDKAHPGVFDNSKLKRFVPGFRAQKSFRQGVSESVAFLRRHPERQNRSLELDSLIDEIIQRWRSAQPGAGY